MEYNIDYREDNKWTVYVHIVPKALSGYDWDKYYVGITGVGTKRRWGKNGIGYCSQKYFYNAIQKYGWNNMQHEIIAEHLTEKEAKDMEVSLIENLKSNDNIHGYNLTFGGDSVSINDYYITAQYDLKGYLLNIYPSMREARRITGISIDCAIHGKALKAGNFQWRKYNNRDEVLLKIERYKKPRYGRKVLQYDLYGNFIEKWDGGISEIKEILGYSQSTISNCCNGKILSSHGCKWRWENSDLPLNNVKIACGRYTMYYRYTIDGKFIDQYLGKEELKDKFGIQKDMVTVLINNIQNNYFKGYRFTNKYYEQLPPLIKNYTRRGDKYYCQYDSEGNFIKSFTSTKDKALSLNISVQAFRTAISKCCKDINNNFYKGYRWTNQYYEKLPPLSEKGLKQVKEYERKN